MAQVILLERIPKLGQMGDEVTVRPGYARNYLIPQGKALRATKDNRTVFDNRRHEITTRDIERRSEAEAVAAKMADISLTVIRQAGETGHLYGSVTARDIVAALKDEAALVLERRQVVLNTPIKTLGLHRIHVLIHADVHIEVVVNVARSAEEAAHRLEALSDPRARSTKDASPPVAAADAADAPASEVPADGESPAADAAQEPPATKA